MLLDRGGVGRSAHGLIFLVASIQLSVTFVIKLDLLIIVIVTMLKDCSVYLMVTLFFCWAWMTSAS